jgi:hypothetical protein
MRSLQFITEKNQLHQLKLNTDEQVANVNHPSNASFLNKLIYISQYKNTNKAIQFDSCNAPINSIQFQTERIILFDDVSSTNSIQQRHAFMYRKEDFNLNLFIFVIVLVATLVLVYQAFKADLTD